MTELQSQLLAWYSTNARDLPWRKTNNPYHIWVSEVILQQTQVKTGLGYYLRFVERFPTVQDLANATEPEVLKVWEGCGYYARARNLHAGARQIVSQGMPTSYAGWLGIKGVGDYTASAVSSIAFGCPEAVVDGNVRRVLGRLFALPEPSHTQLKTLASELLYRPEPGAWNQAVMELGAVMCSPKAPKCTACPVAQYCLALVSGNPSQYPAAKKRPTIRTISAVVFLIGTPENFYSEQRPSKGLFGGLHGLPVQEIIHTETEAVETLAQRLQATVQQKLGIVEHTLTHRYMVLHVYTARAEVLLQPKHVAMPNLDRKALALWNTPLLF